MFFFMGAFGALTSPGFKLYVKYKGGGSSEQTCSMPGVPPAVRADRKHGHLLGSPEMWAGDWEGLCQWLILLETCLE